MGEKQRSDEFEGLLDRADEWYEYKHSQDSIRDRRCGVQRAFPQMDVGRGDYIYHIVVVRVKK